MSLNKPVRRIAIIGRGVVSASWAAEFLARGLDFIATDVHGKLDLVKIPDRRTTVARPGNLPDADWLHLEKVGVQSRLQAKRQVQWPRNLASRVLPVSQTWDGPAGHWCLRGMRERAKAMRGQLEVWSEHEAGTEVELTIPASVAYVAHEERRFRFCARKVGLAP